MIKVGFVSGPLSKPQSSVRRLNSLKKKWFITLNTITASAKEVSFTFSVLVCLWGDAKTAGWDSTTFGGNVENGTRELI